MASDNSPAALGEILSGALFSEPMRVVALAPAKGETSELGLVGILTNINVAALLRTRNVMVIAAIKFDDLASMWPRS